MRTPMRVMIVLGSGLLASLGGGAEAQTTSAPIEDPARAAVLANLHGIVDAFHAAAARADEEAYFDLLAPTAVFLGTDATERWDRESFRAYAHPVFAAGRGWEFRPRHRTIDLAADRRLAWFDELLDNDKYGECRGSGVLEVLDGNWRIQQYHLTIPVPNELALDVVADIRKAQARAAPRVIPLADYIAGLKTVPVELGGERFDFLFDTAGGLTLLTPKLIPRAGCEPFGRLLGFRHDGGQITAPRCGPISLAIGGEPPLEVEVAIWDLMSLLHGAPEVGGLVSLASFEGETLTLDWKGNQLILESLASRTDRVRDMKPLRLRASRQAGGAGLDLVLAIRGPNGLLWFELDSGSVAPVLVSPHAAAELGAQLSTSEPRPLTFEVEGLGPMTLPALEKEMIYDGVLNVDFVSRVLLTLDLKDLRGWVRLQPETAAEEVLQKVPATSAEGG